MRVIRTNSLAFALSAFSAMAVQGDGLAAPAPKAGGRVGGFVGGRSTYEDYAGKATITKIEKTERSKAQVKVNGGPGYEGYAIWFTFSTDKELKQEWAKNALKKERLLQLTNSWYPGPKYLEKYGIKKGQTFKCTMKVITSGTSSPIVFRFEGLDRADYFETKRE